MDTEHPCPIQTNTAQVASNRLHPFEGSESLKNDVVGRSAGDCGTAPPRHRDAENSLEHRAQAVLRGSVTPVQQQLQLPLQRR